MPADVNASLDKRRILESNPDFAYSRLVCARKLKPATAYHAFVIPVCESGRLAGVGSTAAAIANAKLKIAWEGPDLEFPYYYRWQFSTGTVGDFEYLVRLLKPKVADSRAGRRVMDMTKPDGSLVWKEDPDNPLGGILRLGGALKVPKESLTDEEIARTEKFDQWAIKNCRLCTHSPFNSPASSIWRMTITCFLRLQPTPTPAMTAICRLIPTKIRNR
jgi:hypothetical protein